MSGSVESTWRDHDATTALAHLSGRLFREIVGLRSCLVEYQNLPALSKFNDEGGLRRRLSVRRCSYRSCIHHGFGETHNISEGTVAILSIIINTAMAEVMVWWCSNTIVNSIVTAVIFNITSTSVVTSQPHPTPQPPHHLDDQHGHPSPASPSPSSSFIIALYQHLHQHLHDHLP